MLWKYILDNFTEYHLLLIWKCRQDKFRKKNKIRKVKMQFYIQCYALKKQKKLKKFYYIQCYGIKKFEIYIKM